MLERKPQTELTVGRAPVQVVEIMTQRCANEFGCGPCRAGLGNVAEAGALAVNFAQIGNPAEWVALGATAARVPGGVLISSNSNEPIYQNNASGGEFNGDLFSFVTVCITPQVDMDLSTTQTALFYRNASQAFSAGTSMNPVNATNSFRGKMDLSSCKAGEMLTLVFDARTSSDYATQWQGQTINGLRFDIGNLPTDEFVIHSISISDQSLVDAAGSECYKTRNTCQDVDRYRALPDGHVVATASYLEKDVITYSEDGFDNTANAYFVVEGIRFDTSPSGTVFHLGDAITSGFYMGITGSDLVVRAGGSSSATPADGAVIRTPVDAFIAKTVTLIVEIEDGAGKISLWEFDALDRKLRLVQTATASSAWSTWTAEVDGAVGVEDGTVPVGEDGGAWNGRINAVKFFSGLLFDGSAADQFRHYAYYEQAISDKPAEDVPLLPYLTDVSTAPTKVSLAGSNTDTDPIGNRARVSVVMSEQPSNDLNGDDPYRFDRREDPMRKPGGYWAKWRVRQKFGRQGCRLAVLEGYAGQRFSDMARREYLFEQIDFPNRQSVSLKGRDVLSRAELKKAQVPVQSPGLLNADIDETAVVVEVKNATLRDYPVPGTIRINQEIMLITAAAENASDPTVIDLTVTRGQDRSEEAEHSADDGVQLCRRFTQRRVASILTELVADDAEIPAQNLDLVNWVAEDDGFLSAYIFDALITEPTSVALLVGELMESCSSFIYFDERSQLIKLQALKALSDVPATIRESIDIVADSFGILEKPKEQATRVQVYYNPVDFVEQLRDPADFLSGYIDADTTLERQDAYGLKQTRTILSRWINTNAQATQTASRIANRYQDVPIEITFALDAKDRSFWIGDGVFVQHQELVDENGDYDLTRNFIITSAEEIVAGEIVRYTAEDAALAGFIYLIASNTQGDRTGDAEVDGFYAFVTDNNGSAGDGSPGAKIS